MDEKHITQAIAVFAGLAGVVALGYLAVFVLIPLTIVVVLIDTMFRSSYNKKLKEVKAGTDLYAGVQLQQLEAVVHEGFPVIGWKVSLPRDSFLEIYRLENQPSGLASSVQEKGTCIHTVFHDGRSEYDGFFVDKDAPNGLLFYAAVLTGKFVEKRPLDYHFMDFSRQVQYSTRRETICVVAHVAQVNYVVDIQEPLILEDDRDEATIAAEEILQSINERKNFDTRLDAAIDKINSTEGLSDVEKNEAIELLETRFASQ